MRIIIPGPPIAKLRPRFAMRGSKPVAYDSQAKIAQDQRIALSNQLLNNCQADLNACFGSPLSLTISFDMSINLSDSSPVKTQKKWNIAYRPSIKPDIDNLIKHSLDICNGLAWRDDAQIVELLAVQKFSENPCTIIDVTPINTYMNEHAKTVTSIFSPQELNLLSAHLMVLKNALDDIPLTETDERIFFIEHASTELIWFANEYAQKFKKLINP